MRYLQHKLTLEPVGKPCVGDQILLCELGELLECGLGTYMANFVICIVEVSLRTTNLTRATCSAHVTGPESHSTCAQALSVLKFNLPSVYN